jgi:hypothetical protein
MVSEEPQGQTDPENEEIRAGYARTCMSFGRCGETTPALTVQHVRSAGPQAQRMADILLRQLRQRAMQLTIAKPEEYPHAVWR